MIVLSDQRDAALREVQRLEAELSGALSDNVGLRVRLSAAAAECDALRDEAAGARERARASDASVDALRRELDMERELRVDAEERCVRAAVDAAAVSSPMAMQMRLDSSSIGGSPMMTSRGRALSFGNGNVNVNGNGNGNGNGNANANGSGSGFRSSVCPDPSAHLHSSNSDYKSGHHGNSPSTTTHTACEATIRDLQLALVRAREDLGASGAMQRESELREQLRGAEHDRDAALADLELARSRAAKAAAQPPRGSPRVAAVSPSSGGGGGGGSGNTVVDADVLCRLAASLADLRETVAAPRSNDLPTTLLYALCNEIDTRLISAASAGDALAAAAHIATTSTATTTATAIPSSSSASLSSMASTSVSSSSGSSLAPPPSLLAGQAPPHSSSSPASPLPSSSVSMTVATADVLAVYQMAREALARLERRQSAVLAAVAAAQDHCAGLAAGAGRFGSETRTPGGNMASESGNGALRREITGALGGVTPMRSAALAYMFPGGSPIAPPHPTASEEQEHLERRLRVTSDELAVAVAETDSLRAEIAELREAYGAAVSTCEALRRGQQQQQQQQQQHQFGTSASTPSSARFCAFTSF
jgi:hypothetical protein